LIPMCSPR